MKTIFFNSRALILCGEDRPGDEDPGAVIMVDNGEEALTEAVRTIDTNENISRLYILCSDIEGTYNRLKTLFTEVDAAGGLVRNADGQFLLILRNGIWDLPKGKREKGEDVAQTAVREVMEETGIPAPEEGRLICVTDHTYHRDGQFVLKHTHWYAMRLTGRHNADSMGPRRRTARLCGTDLPFHPGGTARSRPDLNGVHPPVYLISVM